MEALFVLLVVASLLLAGYGIIEMRESKTGICFTGFSVLFGIYARLVWVAMQQRKVPHLPGGKPQNRKKVPTRQELQDAADRKKKRTES